MNIVTFTYICTVHLYFYVCVVCLLVIHYNTLQYSMMFIIYLLKLYVKKHYVTLLKLFFFYVLYYLFVSLRNVYFTFFVCIDIQNLFF
jgi:hypothetical protein